MIKGLYRRLALVLLIVFLVLAAFFVWLYESSNQSLQQETAQKLHLHLADYLLTEDRILEGHDWDKASIKDAFSRVMMLDPGTEIYIVDPQGKVLFYDAPDEKIIRRQISIEPIKQFLTNKDALPILGDDPRSHRQKIFSVAKIDDKQDGVMGYLYIIINGEIYDNTIDTLKQNETWRLSFMLMGIALSFLLLSALVLFYNLTRPLVRLSKEVATFEKSEFTVLPAHASDKASIDVDHDDELQQLQGAFYRLGLSQQHQLALLNKQDELRREFLAHVSHDLRTPLAGIRAYLETLQLQTELSDEERNDYLDKALVTTERMSGMINEVFDFARLEHGDISLNPESIRVTDLLSDMYAVLSELAHEKNITLKMEVEDAQVEVYADVARLDRILQNLISNAIHYTPEGGDVTVHIAKAQQGTVKLLVSDTGAGIDKADLPNIFEPYFRGSGGLMSYKEGKGLGLAITHRLLKLHNVSLQVESEKHRGTRFSFSLPVPD